MYKVIITNSDDTVVESFEIPPTKLEQNYADNPITSIEEIQDSIDYGNPKPEYLHRFIGECVLDSILADL